MKVALVGDLSQNDPALLARALDVALAAADVVVQLGDVNPGYQVVKDRLGTGKLLVVPGNHDTVGPGNWDASLGLPKQWRRDYPLSPGGAAKLTILGLDNSRDSFDAAARQLVLDAVNNRSAYDTLLVCMHKSMTTLVLPDGTESSHVMGEGGPIPNPDAQDVIALLEGEKSRDLAVCCGHYHGQSVMQTSYGPVLLEGRGGAAGAANLGYTLVVTTADGWVAHPVQI